MREKSSINVVTIVLIILAVFTTAFAFINYQYKVPVWPLGGNYPLTLVIFVSLLLGIPIGALGHNLLGLLRIRRTERLTTTPTSDRHPGRP